MKRLLTFILAFSMIISLVPAISASAEGKTIEYTYNLNPGIRNNDNTTGYSAQLVKDYNITGDTWIYYTKTAGTAYGYANKYIEIKSDVGEYFAIKMKVPRDGIYDISFTQYLHAANGGYIDVYLLSGDTAKADIAAGLIDKNKLNKEAIRGFAETNTQDSTTKVTSKREIAAGEYVFVFYAASLKDNGTGTTAWMYPAMVTLLSSATDSAQEKADAAFNAAETETKYTEPSLIGLTIGGKVIDGVPNGDGTFDITAPAAKENGSKFLYWAKALTTKKTILLYKTNELKNYIPGENGRELLIAVYEDELPTSAEYYNANGQLIPDAKDSDRPYMAGYGTASGWKQYGETNIRVAEYDNKTQPDPVTVTVVYGNGGGTVPYGAPVTCTADEATYGTFRWWQKDVNGVSEIVSVDKSYTFLAYEDCTVTAVYGDGGVSVANPVKIIIDTFGENSVMAEFIGFGNNVVEKGIMWNNNKIAMTAPGNQFTVTADKVGTNTFVGYAIVGNATDGYTLITDGEAKITIAE